MLMYYYKLLKFDCLNPSREVLIEGERSLAIRSVLHCESLQGSTVKSLARWASDEQRHTRQ